jgi:hypothetical protein
LYGVSKQGEFHADSKLKWARKMFRKKVISKNFANFEFFDFALFTKFFAYNFFPEHYFELISKKFESAKNVLHFFHAYAQNMEHFRQVCKSNNLDFANIYQSQFESHQFLKIEDPEPCIKGRYIL